MLSEIDVRHFRLFSQLKIDDLARVNLIVGLNNSGKSTLLEAIFLLMSQNNPSALLELLSLRGETVYLNDRNQKPSGRGFQSSHVFWGHQLTPNNRIDISGVNLDRKQLRIYLEPRQVSLFESHPFESGVADLDTATANLVIDYGEHQRYTLPVDGDGILLERYIRTPRTGRSGQDTPVNLVTTEYLDYEQIARLWDQITLTDKEMKVVEALQILEPKVQRISFTSQRTSNSGILVKIQDETVPVPLGSLGDGMRRILALIASLVNSENGILLVDEIDAGLHYSILEDVWRLIFDTAERLNLQVFATTHSGDCVKAFSKVSQHYEEKAGRLLRMEQHGNKQKAVDYQADELAIALLEEIEVR